MKATQEVISSVAIMGTCLWAWGSCSFVSAASRALEKVEIYSFDEKGLVSLIMSNT